MFLTPEDFNQFPYIIPAAEEKQQLQAFINKEEERVLRKLLGNVMYNSLANGYATQQIWMDVVGPKDYSDGKYRWAGLKAALTPYMCSEWLRKNFDQYDDNGVSVAKMESADRIDPTTKIVNWYNEYVRCVGHNRCTENTLYGFLKSDTVNYSTLVWGCPKFMNPWNL